MFSLGCDIWLDSTDPEEKLIKGLCSKIEQCFTNLKHLEEALTKLEQFFQGNKKTEEYISEFKNLKHKANITDDYVKHLLVKNARGDLMSKLFCQEGVNCSYEQLLQLLSEISQGDQLYKLSKTTTHPSPFNQKSPQ